MKTKKSKLSLELATKMYNGTDEQLKEFALLNFPELGMKVTDRVKTLSDAYKELGADGALAQNLIEQTANLSKDELAYKKLKVIAEALNEGWKPNWDDSNERKYYPWFKKSLSGVGFSSFDYDCDRSGTGVGSRLVFKSEDLAKYAGTQFLEIYNDFLIL